MGSTGVQLMVEKADRACLELIRIQELNTATLGKRWLCWLTHVGRAQAGQQQGPCEGARRFGTSMACFPLPPRLR